MHREAKHQAPLNLPHQAPLNLPHTMLLRHWQTQTLRVSLFQPKRACSYQCKFPARPLVLVYRARLAMSAMLDPRAWAWSCLLCGVGCPTHFIFLLLLLDAKMGQ